MTQMPITLNDWQKAIARTYGGGDYAEFADNGVMTALDLDACGDTLFRFLILELADSEGCDSLEEAIRRCGSARDQLDEAIAVLEAP